MILSADIPCCSMGNEAAAQTLLELGADPNASGSSSGAAALHALCGLPHAACKQLARLLMQHGADCLVPVSAINSDSLLVFFMAMQPKGALAALLLAHLEQQRAAGQLQLGSAARAAQLVLAALRGGHQQLLSHSLHCLAQQLSAAGNAPSAELAAVLRTILEAAIDNASRSSPAGLQALLAARLPLDLDAPSTNGLSHVTRAARFGSSRVAKVQLLHQAGAADHS